MTTPQFWLGLGLGIILSVIVGTCSAGAHESWISRGAYRSPIDGSGCCGTGDCFIVPATDMQSTPAGWRISSTGETIPFAEAQMSEDGQFWRCKKLDQSRRCFFAPPMGF